MSSPKPIHALKDQLDQRTHDIVFGYVRRNQKILYCKYKDISSSGNGINYYLIPNIIILTILQYVYEHFMMTFGSYKWEINDYDIIKSFYKSFKNGNKYESNIFEIGKLNWRIEAYPNGYHKDSVGSFKLYVKLLSLPPKWNNVIVCRTTQCLQSMSKVTNICMYKKDESYGWTTGSLLLKEIKEQKYKTLTFIVTMRILQINLIDDHENNNNDLPSPKSTIFYQYDLKRQYRKKYNLHWKISGLL